MFYVKRTMRFEYPSCRIEVKGLYIARRPALKGWVWSKW